MPSARPVLGVTVNVALSLGASVVLLKLEKVKLAGLAAVFKVTVRFPVFLTVTVFPGCAP